MSNQQAARIPALLGIRFDANSSYLRGAADAPPVIREAFCCDSSNSSTESGIELNAESFLDAGDVKLPSDGAFTAIESAVRGLLDQGHAPVCLGGDHSITYPIVRAFNKRFADLTIVHVGSSRVDLQACKLEYSIVSPK